MSNAPLRIAVILASTREGRFAPVVGRWLVEQAAARTDMEVDLIDLAEAALPEVLTRHRPPSVEALAPRLAEADAYVIVTPEYNHSFPAPLKTAIDWYNAEWHAKPVGFVSYGGMSGGLRAVEQLRQVFGELHAVSVRNGVSFHLAWEQFDAQGRLHDSEGVDAATRMMLDQLAWWGRALRNARAEQPYAA